MKRVLAFAAAAAVCSAIPCAAMAQDGQPVYSEPPRTTTPQQQPPPKIIVVNAPAPPEPEKKYLPRFRWGLWFEGGPMFYAGQTGGEGAVTVRMGVQVNELLGFYGQAIGILGGAASNSAKGIGAAGLIGAGFAGMADLTLGNLWFIAAGPELMAGIIGAEHTGVGTMAQGAAGGFFAIAARTGLALGNTSDPRQRRAFTFGLDFHLILTPYDPVIAPMIALGYDQF